MEINRQGSTRIVLIFNKFVIKVPNFMYQHSHFIQGCYCNWKEREYSKSWKNCKDCNLYNKIAPTYFCSWFGLLQIQAKCLPKKEDLTNLEIEEYKNLSFGDIKKDNFGYFKGRLVCLDYGQKEQN